MQFRLPDVGEGITESVLLKWHFRPGQSIKEDDTLCVIETDKAVVEIPAPCTGRLVSIAVEEGATVAVGTVIAEVDAEGAHAAPLQAAAPQAAPPEAKRDPEKTANGRSRRTAAAPSTRRYASELGVNLATLTGTGPNGRILRSDVSAAAAPASRPAGEARSPVQGERSSERTPMTPLRRAIAQNLQRSVSVIPHATSSFRCDAGAFAALRERLEKRFGQRVSYTAMVMKTMVPALKAFPYFNASIDDDAQEIVTHRAYHIGFATHTEEGLIVPVVRDVDRKSLLEVSGEIEKLAAQARERRIALADLRGGTITLSNIGSHGGHEVGGRPIINHPQVAIIVVGRIRPEPAVYDNAVTVRPTLNLITSYDHRLIDGAYASRFMEHLIDMIEDPGMLLALG